MRDSLQRARWAVTALFFTNGALYANVAPRFPEIKTALEMSDTAYGLGISAFAIGALVAGLGAARLIRHWGAPTVAVISTVLTGLSILGAGLARVPLAFATGLFMAGAMDAITDVAQNDHGLQIQERMGKSIINGFHATWSMGAVAGGAMAAGAIAWGLPLPIHLMGSAVLFSTVALVAKHFCLRERRSLTVQPNNRAGGHHQPDERTTAQLDTDQTRIPVHVIGLLLAITGITAASTMVEDLGASWASLYLRDSLHLSGQITAFGLVVVAGAQFVGRMLGDRMVDRWGQVTMARVGGFLVAAGLGMALLLPTPATTFIGFIAAGFGVATLVPSAFHAADTLPGLPPGTGLTIVAWLMRLSFLMMPPLIGWISDVFSLRIALSIIPLVGVATVVIAPVLKPRATTTGSIGLDTN